ncbi:hypothetical protein BJ944DRAFT_247709 [Cunninghamella echinulata]|nr:hypothetical protein BJ944DRAFT_247709 [Cunninghamella echinulata]
MPLRIFNNFTSKQIYRFFLSLFGIYHVNSIEDSSSTSSSITATFSSEIVLNSIMMIQPMNDMDKWSTYFWIKRISALFYYAPYYKTNKYSNKNANTNFINTMISSSPMTKTTTTATATATTETIPSTLASNILYSSSYSSTSSNSTIVPSITANLSSLSFKNITTKSNSNHELTINESLYPSLLSSSSLQTELTLTSPPSPPMIILIKQLLMIQKQTRDIIHQLDHLRPSEIFAKSSRTALAIHQCLRFSTDMLRSHSILALLNIMGILQDLLDHSPSELKRQVFYKSKLGRFMILEMATILKTSSLASLSTVSLFYYDKYYNNNNNNLDIMISQSSSSSTLCEKDLDLHHWIQFLITSLQPPTLINQEGWILDWLKLVCISISTYDKTWVHRQEYENVISLAAHYL